MPAVEQDTSDRLLRRFVDDAGTGLVEYCLLMALIVLVCLGALQAFGQSVPAGSLDQVTSTVSN